MIHTQGKGEKILKKFTVIYIQKGLTLVIYIVENEFRLANDMYSLIGHPLLNFVIFCVQMLMACTHSGERPILCPRWLISFNIIFPFHQKKKKKSVDIAYINIVSEWPNYVRYCCIM